MKKCSNCKHAVELPEKWRGFKRFTLGCEAPVEGFAILGILMVRKDHCCAQFEAKPKEKDPRQAELFQ